MDATTGLSNGQLVRCGPWPAAGNATPFMACTIVNAFSNVVLPLLGPLVAMAHALS